MLNLTFLITEERKKFALLKREEQHLEKEKEEDQRRNVELIRQANLASDAIGNENVNQYAIWRVENSAWFEVKQDYKRNRETLRRLRVGLDIWALEMTMRRRKFLLSVAGDSDTVILNAPIDTFEQASRKRPQDI